MDDLNRDHSRADHGGERGQQNRLDVDTPASGRTSQLMSIKGRP